MKKLSLIVVVLMLTGCSMFGGGEKVITKPVIVDRPKLEITYPEQAQQLPIEWVVITKDNFESVVKEMESKNQRIVFFALTPDGYKNLSISVAELRRYIQQQNSLIGVIKEYYERPNQQENTDSIKK